MKAIAILGLAILMSGCSQLDKISDDDLARDLLVGARGAVKYSLQAAFRKATPDEAARLSKDALAADQVITQNLIPVFSGAQTTDVLRSSVDAALALFKNKVSNPKLAAAIDLGIEVIAMEVKLPKNPTDKLDERTRKAILGALSGISEGIRGAIPPPDAAPIPARDTMSLPK